MYLNYLLKFKVNVEKAEFLSYFSYEDEEVIENKRPLENHHTYILGKFLILRRVEHFEIFEKLVFAIIIEIRSIIHIIELINSICNLQPMLSFGSICFVCILVIFNVIAKQKL